MRSHNALPLGAALVGLGLLLAVCDIALRRPWDVSLIGQGTGVVVSVLWAGAGWLIRAALEAERTRRNIGQSYASLIQSHFDELNDSLSDAVLQRFLALAPAIATNPELESIGVRTDNPFAELPSLNGNLHLFSPGLVDLLTRWRSRGEELYKAYDQLGTARLSKLGTERVGAWLEWLKGYRLQYRDLSYSALKRLEAEIPGLRINYDILEAAGARAFRAQSIAPVALNP